MLKSAHKVPIHLAGLACQPPASQEETTMQIRDALAQTRRDETGRDDDDLLALFDGEEDE